MTMYDVVTQLQLASWNDIELVTKFLRLPSIEAVGCAS